jgi:hypothetical protein
MYAVYIPFAGFDKISRWFLVRLTISRHANRSSHQAKATVLTSQLCVGNQAGGASLYLTWQIGHPLKAARAL